MGSPWVGSVSPSRYVSVGQRRQRDVPGGGPVGRLGHLRPAKGLQQPLSGPLCALGPVLAGREARAQVLGGERLDGGEDEVVYAGQQHEEQPVAETRLRRGV